MGMGSSTLDINFGDSDPQTVADVKAGKSAAEIWQAKINRGYSKPPPVPTLDITDSQLATARANTALQLQTGSRKGSFLTGPTAVGGGDAGLAQRQALLALTNANGKGS